MNKAMSKYLKALTQRTKLARVNYAKGRGIDAWKQYFDSLSAIQYVMIYDTEITSIEFNTFLKLCGKKLKEFDKYYL
jgi:hypothetical protein